MHISLTHDPEEFVTRKVESGMYQTPSEVIRESLRLLREQDEIHQRKLEELRREIAIGIEQADRGQVGPLNAQETLARVREKRTAQPPKKS